MSKTFKILFTPPFIPFALIFSHILPHTCAQLSPQDFPTSPWGPPSESRERSRSSKHPRAQPGCGTSIPQTHPGGQCPGLGSRDTPTLGKLFPGNTSLHRRSQVEKLLSLPSRTQQRSLPCSFRQEGCARTQGGGPGPLTCRGQGKQIQLAPGTRIPLSLQPGATQTFGMGRMLSLPPQLSRALSAVSSRGSHPGFLPPASGSSFWDLSRMAGGDPAPQAPWWLRQQLQSRECPISSRRKSRSSPRAALGCAAKQRSRIYSGRDNGSLCRARRSREERGAR